MNAQEAFNTVWHAFVVEKKPPSYREDTATGDCVCLYRGTNGAKCAIGALIPDDCYSSSMEGRMPTDLKEEFGAAQPYLGSLSEEFMNELQDCHDDAALEANAVGDGKRFHFRAQKKLRHFAVTWKLTMPGEGGE